LKKKKTVFMIHPFVRSFNVAVDVDVKFKVFCYKRVLTSKLSSHMYYLSDSMNSLSLSPVYLPPSFFLFQSLFLCLPGFFSLSLQCIFFILSFSLFVCSLPLLLSLFIYLFILFYLLVPLSISPYLCLYFLCHSQENTLCSQAATHYYKKFISMIRNFWKLKSFL